MLVSQIAVFLENSKGRLNAMLKALSEANVNLQNLNIADTSDFGIVRMITDDDVKAVSALQDAGFTASTGKLVAVEVADRPGSLCKTVDCLYAAGINIEYVYSYTCEKDKTLVLVKTDNMELAQKVLEENNI